MDQDTVMLYRQALRGYKKIRDLHGIPERVIKEVVYALRGEDLETPPSQFRAYEPSAWEMWYLLDRIVVLTTLVHDIIARTRDAYHEADRVFQTLKVVAGYRLPDA